MLFLDMGGTVYDTARVYSDWIPSEIGRSERVLGQWLRQSGKRHDIVLLSKGGHPDMTPSVPDMHASQDFCRKYASGSGTFSCCAWYRLY